MSFCMKLGKTLEYQYITGREENQIRDYEEEKEQ